MTPSHPRPTMLAIAQPPAKAAPNTSAPIRMAALTTVSTCVQMIWRPPLVESVMTLGPWVGVTEAHLRHLAGGSRPQGAVGRVGRNSHGAHRFPNHHRSRRAMAYSAASESVGVFGGLRRSLRQEGGAPPDPPYGLHRQELRE